MTGIIRSARVATESKTLPVPSASVPLPPVHAAGAAQIDAAARNQASEAPISHVASYEHYKQRLEGELAELRRQAIASGKKEGLEQGLEQGLQQGLQQGREAAAAECRRELEALRQLIGTAREARDRHVEDVAEEAAEIVFAAVAKILGDGFQDRSAAVAAVAEAIRRSKARGKLLVRVSPADHPLLESRRSELLDGASTREIEIVPDDQVTLGGCILDSGASGSLDARLDVQLERLREALLQARSSWGTAT